MRWLFVTTEFPWPIAHGTWLRVYHLARSLVRGGDDVALFAHGAAPEAMAAYIAFGATVLSEPKDCRTDCRAEPYDSDPDLAEGIARHSGSYDVVVLTHSRTLQYSSHAAGAACVVADLVDDLLLEESRKLWRDLRPGRWIRRLLFLVRQRRYERCFLNPVRQVTFVSDVDAHSFSRRHRRQRVAVVRNGVDVSFFDPAAPPQDHPVDRPSVVFLGHQSHPPNADAALSLVRDIAPLIWQAQPRAKVVIVGPSPSPALRSHAGENVEITGWVDDVRPWLWRATVIALPMRIGTGLKNKLLEAWAARCAVVATSLACQGVPARHGENLLCADTPRAVAGAVVSLIGDRTLRHRLGAEGQKTVREHLTWPGAAGKLRQAVARSIRYDSARAAPTAVLA